MASGEVRVEHVSDTALMVAAARAAETARPDAIVRDPFAARRAGARGQALARKLLSPDWLGIGVGLRCRTIDEMLVAAIAAQGVRTVVVLGAGRHGWELVARRAYLQEGFAVAASRGLAPQPDAGEAAAAEDPSGIYWYHRP